MNDWPRFLVSLNARSGDHAGHGVSRVNGANGASFDRARPLTLARAPGRLDVMGGIADYSGSLVLEMPIAQATCAAVQQTNQPQLHVTSQGFEENTGENTEPRSALLDLDQLRSLAKQGFDVARVTLEQEQPAWVAYVAGCLVFLLSEHAAHVAGGLNVLITSEVPEGKGVSSSAALEVAVMQALAAELGVRLEPVELALACQRVENLIVGAPCGVMDQMTSALGQEARLLAILCQPAEVQGTLACPPQLAFWGIDSGVRHSVAGADYAQVRAAAFMGQRMIAELEGMAVQVVGAGQVNIDDTRYGGYLANVPPSTFQERYVRYLPERVVGREFLARYTGVADAVSRIQPELAYPVRAATAHPIFEHQRVTAFRELLPRGAELSVARQLGQWMFESHASYSACGLGCPETDRLVSLAREQGTEQGTEQTLFGAKVSGAGSGGMVVVLGRAEADPVVERIAERYVKERYAAAEQNVAPLVLRGSSPGAVAWGVRTARWSTDGWAVVPRA